MTGVLINTMFMIIRFLIYGAIGWCMEVMWTGVGSAVRGDRTLSSSTSLWMFPIYGSAVLMELIYGALAGLPLPVRGVVYMLCIFGMELASGLMLLNVGACPWDYSRARYNIAGVIRLDYAPLWFAVGIFYEWLFKNFLVYL